MEQHDCFAAFAIHLGRCWMGPQGLLREPMSLPGASQLFEASRFQPAHTQTIPLLDLGQSHPCTTYEPQPIPPHLQLAVPLRQMALHFEGKGGGQSFHGFGVCLIDGMGQTPYRRFQNEGPLILEHLAPQNSWRSPDIGFLWEEWMQLCIRPNSSILWAAPNVQSIVSLPLCLDQHSPSFPHTLEAT